MKETVEKMIRIVRGDTGGSRVYADMLLSMLPNSDHKVNMSYWCYKADKDDFEAMLKLMSAYKSYDDSLIWEYEKLVLPYVDELKKYVGEEDE